MIDKIEIGTKNKNHAIDIAILVDKEEFLLELQRLRAKWKITELTKLTIAPNIQKLLNIDTILAEGTFDIKDLQKKKEELNDDINKVLEKFNRGKNFRVVIEYALFAGVVPEEVYKSCYFDIATLNEQEDLSKPEKYHYIIVVSPRTEKQEVDDVFDELQEHIKDKIEFESRTLPTLKENGNLITHEEEKELGELLARIKIEYEKYQENKKTATTIRDTMREYDKFVDNTKNLREKAELLFSKLPLDSDNPMDRDLIEQYHKGAIYAGDTIVVSNKLILNRTRDWYFLAYKDSFNDKSKKRKRSRVILDEWQKENCPVKTNHKDVESKLKCPYCSVEDINLVDQALSTYRRILKNS